MAGVSLWTLKHIFETKCGYVETSAKNMIRMETKGWVQSGMTVKYFSLKMSSCECVRFIGGDFYGCRSIL